MFGLENLYNEMLAAKKKGEHDIAKKRAEAIRRLYYSKSLYRFPIILGYKNTENLKQVMAPYTSVVLRSDCEDLSPILETVKYVEIDRKEYAKKLKEVENQKHILVLQQLLHTTEKQDALLEELDTCTIIWCCFVQEIEDLEHFLTKRHYRVKTLYGKTKNRQKIIKNFGRTFNILVAQPQAGGEGIDLSAANKIIWYSHPLKAVVQRQANERATKQSKDSVEIIKLAAVNTLDEYLIKLLDKKSNLADDIARFGLRHILDQL